MKRLQSPRHLPYRVVEDTRREPLRLGKYLYLLIIALIVLYLLHRGFGWVYLMRGDGFVYGEGWTLAFEHDVTVQELDAREGEHVAAGMPLLRVSSSSFQERAATLAAEVAAAYDRIQDAESRLQGLRAERRVAGQELEFATAQYEQAADGASRGLVISEDLSDFAHARFRVLREVERLDAEIRTLAAEIGTLREAVERVGGHYRALLGGFGSGRCTPPAVPGAEAVGEVGDAGAAAGTEGAAGGEAGDAPGTCRSPQAGVVAHMEITPGSVVRQGEALLQVFGDERYVLAYLDHRSPVSHAPGAPILLRFRGEGWSLGRIGQPTAIAERLPPEFQPRFAQVTRDRLVIIEVDPGVLAEATMLTTVRLYKPIGLEAVLALLGHAP